MTFFPEAPLALLGIEAGIRSLFSAIDPVRAKFGYENASVVIGYVNSEATELPG